MGWTTQDQVKAQTGLDVDEAAIAMASAIITTYSGAEEELADRLSARDRRVLARATAWQAVWGQMKPGLLTERESQQTVAADSTSSSRWAPSDVILAPLAARELKNLSWVGTRTSIIPSIKERLGDRNFLNEESDIWGEWKPL